MKRLIRELRYFFDQVRNGYPRQEAERRDYVFCQKLKGMVFSDATLFEVYDAAHTIVHYGLHSNLDDVVAALIPRIGRYSGREKRSVVEWADQQARRGGRSPSFRLASGPSNTCSDTSTRPGVR